MPNHVVTIFQVRSASCIAPTRTHVGLAHGWLLRMHRWMPAWLRASVAAGGSSLPQAQQLRATSWRAPALPDAASEVCGATPRAVCTLGGAAAICSLSPSH